MAQLITLKSFCDSRGSLTVIENVIPFIIKRIFYIYGVDDSVRGKHRHLKTRQAAICLTGSCKIYSINETEEVVYNIDSPDKLLLIEPDDWHKMYEFSSNAILMILASEKYDPADYVYKLP